MDARLSAHLDQEQQSEFHQNLLDQCKALVGMSRSHMKKFYDQWDHNCEVYRGVRTADQADKDAAQRGEPEKMVVPVSHAQVEALIAFCMSLFLQRNSVFELIATGEEDEKAAAVAQAVLDRDLAWNKFELVLRQFILDIARFGIGVINVTWLEKLKTETVQVAIPPVTIFGVQAGEPSIREEKVRKIVYQGNKLTNISPYRFFPDVRLPLHRLQDGEFVAFEDWYNLPNLRAMERDGSVVGIKYVKPLSQQQWEERQRTSRPNNTLLTDQTEADAMTAKGEAKTKMYVMTEMQLNLVPADFMIDGEPLGPETYPVKYNIAYVNDQRIVRLEPLSFDHDEFTCVVGQYAADQEDLVGVSLCDTIDMLQQVLTWFINAHITNVRKVIGDRLVVDPSLVEWNDIVERKPVIRLKQDASGTDVSKAVVQLTTVDVTSRHMQDANELNGWLMQTTGIQHNALGQYFTGRRTAAEANSANSATAARLKTFALTNFRMALEGMAKQMLSNLRQGMDAEQLIRVTGPLVDMVGMASFLKVSKTDLQGTYDFEIFDGTMPSDRAAQAMALQEFLTAAMANPQVVIALGYDPKKIVEEWLTLRGIRHPKRLEMDAVRQQELLLQMMSTGIVDTQPGPTQNEQQTPAAQAGTPPSTGNPNVGRGLPMGGG